MEQIDPVAAQPGHLAQAQPAVRADDDEGSVSLVDGCCELRDLARLEEAHLLRLDPRRLDPVERVAHQDVVLDGGSEHPPQRPVDLMDRCRLQVAGRELRQPGTKHCLVELVELHGAEFGQDVQPEVVEVDAPRRGPEVDERRRPLSHPVGERDATGPRVDPAASITLCEELAFVGLGGLAGPECPRALPPIRTSQPDLVADISGRRGSSFDPHDGSLRRRDSALRRCLIESVSSGVRPVLSDDVVWSVSRANATRQPISCCSMLAPAERFTPDSLADPLAGFADAATLLPRSRHLDGDAMCRHLRVTHLTAVGVAPRGYDTAVDGHGVEAHDPSRAERCGHIDDAARTPSPDCSTPERARRHRRGRERPRCPTTRSGGQRYGHFCASTRCEADLRLRLDVRDQRATGGAAEHRADDRRGSWSARGITRDGGRRGLVATKPAIRQERWRRSVGCRR